MIRVENVTKTYQSGNVEYQALKGLSFEIEKGEYVAIMGPSGSGKSTLMHILGALDIPTTGKYFLDNKDVSTMTQDELSRIRRSKIGYVFQSFNLLPRSTVLRNVMLPLVYNNLPRADRRKRAEKALQAAGLVDEELYQHLSNQLSGGQMQRVAIARALVNDPLLVLADEPTGNLDTKTGEFVLDTFQKLNDDGHTIILITHELDVAQHAKRILILRDGDIQKEETTHQRHVASHRTQKAV